MARIKFKGCLIFAAIGPFVLVSSCLAQQGTRSNSSNTALQKYAKIQNIESSIDEQCGTLDDLARRVEACAKPLMDILRGSIAKWPRTEDDALALCNEYAISERCIKDAARKCSKGIHRTIISTIAISVGRVRKRECNPRSKLTEVVKLTTCIEKHQDAMQAFMANATGRLIAIETQTPNADRRLQSLCCILNDIEREIRRTLNPFCPIEAASTVRMYRGVLEDAIEIICRSPKCTDYMKNYKYKSSDDISGMIASVLRIVFSLDLD